MRARLFDLILGPACPSCGERFRGWRTLGAHRWFDHGDEA